jgi:hypothetical protein
MKKWILIGALGIVGLLILLGGVGWFVLSKPIDPDSAVGQRYAEGFRTSFLETCIERASAGSSDQAVLQKMTAVCECGAEASYQEFKDVPVTEQLSRLQEPEAQQKITDIMTNCMQNAVAQ